MSTRSLLAFTFSILAISSALGGLTARRQTPEKAPTTLSPAAVEKSASKEASTPKPATIDAGKEKALLGRLLKELQRSPRSFVYLRSIGYTETDAEFEELIARNNVIFKRTRIVRRDEQSNRQIPGWPGVTLTPEYKKQHP